MVKKNTSNFQQTIELLYIVRKKPRLLNTHTRSRLTNCLLMLLGNDFPLNLLSPEINEIQK